MSPELRKQYTEALAAAEQASHAARSDAGRASAYQRQVAELQKQLVQQQKPSEADAAKQQAAWQGLSDEYPEIAGPIATEFAAMQASMAQSQQALAVIASERAADAAGREMRQLIDDHPDFGAVVADPAYARWVSEAPPSIQDMVARNSEGVSSAAEASAVLTLYKTQTGVSNTQQHSPVANRRQRQLESGTMPKAHSGGSRVVSGPPDDFDSAFDFFVAQDADP